MSTSQGNDGGNQLPNVAELNVVNLEVARRRLALAQAARANATREEIEARGIRPDVEQIIHHMNRTPSHSFKRTRINHTTAHRIYDEDNDETEDDDHDDKAKAEQEEDEFEEQWQCILAEEGLQDANMFVLAEFRQIARQRIRMLKQATDQWSSLCRPPPKKNRFDLLGSLCTCTDLIVEVCKHLRPLDIVRLYSVCRDFHYIINKHMRSSIFAWAMHMAPTATRIYSSPVYFRWFIPDPYNRRVTPTDQELSRTQLGQAKFDGQLPLNAKEGEVRLIPGLMWLQMVVNREIRVRDIIASLARRGHRLPRGAHLSLKKIWLIMDASTTQARMVLLNNPDFFSDEDLYIAQLFLVKLVLAFNDPVFGPQSSMLMRLMMGQRSLSPLWALLRGKKYRTPAEIRQLKLRYDVGSDQIEVANAAALYGVEMDQLGVMHFEGWGTGPDHLMRPDELIPLEAARRQLDLDACIDEMMIYGHVDFSTGNSQVPSLDEMYMSDDELPPAFKGWKPLKHELIHSGCGNVPFEPGMWLPKHARKARWKTLSEEEKAIILMAEQEEMDEVKELNCARFKFDVTWANLAKLTSETMANKKLGSHFKLLPPSQADMADHLKQFAQPQPLRLGSPDAMVVDSSPAPTFATLPFHPASRWRRKQQPLPDPEDLSTIPDEDLDLDPIRPTELELIFQGCRRARGLPFDTEDDGEPYNKHDILEEYQYQDYPYQLDFQAITTTSATHDTNDAHTSTIGAEAAPAAAAGGEQQEETEFITDSEPHSSSSEEEADDTLPNPYIYNADPFLLLDHTPATSLSEGGNTDEMLLAQADLAYSSAEEEYEGDDDNEGEGDVEAGEVGEAAEGNGGVIDELEEGEIVEDEAGGDARGDEMGEGAAAQGGGAESGQGSGEVRTFAFGETGHDGEMPMWFFNPHGGVMVDIGAGGPDGAVELSNIDWDHFLRNPGEYAVEGQEEDAGVQEAGVGFEFGEIADEMIEDDGMDEAGEGEDEDMMGQDGDGMEEDGPDGDMDEADDNLEENDEWDEDENINEMMEGLQVAEQDAQQQAIQQMTQIQANDDLDLALYIADEDVSEDDRTRKLRDWFRPW
ncbi:hypothetical protein NEMBOFW57_005420 [Staphylotrichum longicolle]|uniref:F-box domain-containing protein n=1 Tax=Staphylotrichum longicolle TaxID=669026 RepID=A0AAD4F1D9_9PEZI|nr:hypothetical protein NEMBOFW57_005420 [Staphylotrichum longicolle]